MTFADFARAPARRAGGEAGERHDPFTSSSVPGTWPHGTARGVPGERRRSDQDRARDGIVRSVGAGRRGAHPRAHHRDRRGQRQGRRPRAQGGARAPRRRSEPGKGRDRRPRARPAREGGGADRRTRHARRAGDRAFRKRAEGALHRSVGGGHGDHGQRGEGQLRVPRLGPRRPRRQGDRELRDQEPFREEARSHPRQQPLGRVRTRRASPRR